MNISRTLGVSLLAAALALGPAAVATASPVPAGTQGTSATLGLFPGSSRETIIETFDGINAFRVSKGLKPLKFNAAISAISQKWSTEMAVTGGFFHNDDYVSGAPAGWDSASENIAWGTWAPPSGKRFVDMWINSPVHNTNMSRPGDDYMGVGIASRDSSTYATVNHFSYRDGVIAPGSYNHPRDYFNGLPALGDSRTVTVTAAAPVFTPATGRYTIPKKIGVAYSVNGKRTAAGAYSSNSRKVTITAEAASGYRLSGTSSWVHDFRKAVTPARPVMSSRADRYTIPRQRGVAYLVDGKVVPAGTYKVANGKRLKFSAKASVSTYRLTGTTSWSFRF